MRLIDSKDFLDLFYVMAMGQDKAFIKAVEQVVSDTPTVDAVEVVRCKDCKWMDSQEFGERFICQMGFRFISKNDFCSYGERKADDKD